MTHYSPFLLSEPDCGRWWIGHSRSDALGIVDCPRCLELIKEKAILEYADKFNSKPKPEFYFDDPDWIRHIEIDKTAFPSSGTATARPQIKYGCPE